MRTWREKIQLPFEATGMALPHFATGQAASTESD